MKKSKKFIKIALASGLAIVIGTGVLFGTLLSQTNSVEILSKENSSQHDAISIIVPRENDPVICELVPGIEIKWGKMHIQSNPLNWTINSGHGNGNLSGFPYFNTFEEGVKYNWVIIGMSESCQFIQEPTDPAGLAIFQEAFNVHRTSKITEGMLCIANTIIDQGIYNDNYRFYYGNGKYYLIMQGTYNGSENISNTMEGYYTNGSFGLASISSYIKEQSLSTYTYGNTYSGTNGYGTTTGWRTYTTTKHIFPLASNASSTFYYGDYLTAEQLKLSERQWLRGNESGNACSCLNADGTFSYIDAGVSNIGYRPAFVLNI